MRKKSLYALVGETRFCDGEGICTSVKKELIQFSFNRKELEGIAYQLNDIRYPGCHWIVEEVS